MERVPVKAGDHVELGQTLFILENPDLDEQIEEGRQRLSVVHARLARQAGSPQDLSDTGVLRRQRAQLDAQIGGFEQRQGKLVIKSRLAEMVVDRAHLKPDQWISPETALAQVVARSAIQAYAYVEEQDLSRVRLGAAARFIASDGDHGRVEMRVAAVDDAGSRQLPYTRLASIYGGPLPVTADSSGTPTVDDSQGRRARGLTLDDGLYRVTLVPVDSRSAPEWQILGQASVEGPAESIAGSVFRHAASVFIRESGF